MSDRFRWCSPGGIRPGLRGQRAMMIKPAVQMAARFARWADPSTALGASCVRPYIGFTTAVTSVTGGDMESSYSFWNGTCETVKRHSVPPAR